MMPGAREIVNPNEEDLKVMQTQTDWKVRDAAHGWIKDISDEVILPGKDLFSLSSLGWRRIPITFYTPDYAGAAKRIFTHNFPILSSFFSHLVFSRSAALPNLGARSCLLINANQSMPERTRASDGCRMDVA